LTTVYNEAVFIYKNQSLKPTICMRSTLDNATAAPLRCTVRGAHPMRTRQPVQLIKTLISLLVTQVINLQIAVTGLEIHSDAISFSPPNHFYDDFNTEELRETFGVSNHEKIPDHEIVKPELHATGNQSEPPWLMRIHFGNRTHQLHLNTVDLENLFSPQLLTVERYNNRTLLNVGSSFAPLCRNHYRTTGTDHVHGALSLCEGMLASCPPNFFIQLCSAKGSFLLNDGGLYTLLPLPKRKNDHLVRLKRMAPTNNFDFHVIYKRQTTSGSFFYPSATFCGVDTSFERTMRDDPTKMKKHNNNWNAPPGSTQFHHDRLVMELAIFIDNELWLRYSRKYGDQAEDKLKDFIYTVFHHVQILYQQPSIEPLIEFSIVRYEIFKTQPKALKGTKHNHGSALSYLNAFCKFQYYLGARKRWDFALLFSGYDIHRPPSDRTISGIARLYGVCDPLNSCLLAEGVDFSSAYIAAHEIGHGLGMLHDEPTCSSDYIMSGSLGAGKVQWSSCSVQSLNNYIRKLDYYHRNCLRVSLFSSNPPNASALLPGQKYSADEQCQMVHGQTFRRIRINEKGDGICHMLWCGQSSWGRVITSHPALEGTACAAGKYCRGGKCVPDRSNNPPKVVDGQWSKWTSVECSSCECPPISSGLGVLSSARSCSNPPPENGGNACSGSSDRGIVCNRACSNALNEITPKLYMNRICISHKHRLNDAFLTGKGAQLTRFNARACKIFCEVNGTNADSISFRFFGDSMPEGSPCGEGHYCINGKCLKLSCDGKALVANENECPLPSESCGQSSVKKEVDLNDDKMTYLRDFRRSNNLASDENSAPTTTAAYKWSSWSEWSECSVTCGSGTKSRSRTCWQGSCVGDSVQREACRQAPCIEGRSNALDEPFWTSWSEWTACSTTCGPGARARYRRCAFGKCVGANDEVEQCINAPCGQWNAWSFWSACSVSCGPGTRTRTRTCADSSCEGSDREIARCNLRSCQSDGVWNSWSEWSSCSVSCGIGIRQRNRVCATGNCNGESHMSEQCQLPRCAVWGAWGQWSECGSQSGIRQRARQCYGLGTCLGPDTESKACEPGNGWTEWSPWSVCSRTCGKGLRRRHRSCLGSVHSCPGDFKIFEVCHEKDCPNVDLGNAKTTLPTQPSTGMYFVGYEWSQWSYCMGRCGTGIRKRIRLCKGHHCRSPIATESQYCQLLPCNTIFHS
ncbi:A disintegrin and metalloproteinase with thrombospondin motifs 17, partial [Trichinella britovi]